MRPGEEEMHAVVDKDKPGSEAGKVSRCVVVKAKVKTDNGKVKAFKTRAGCPCHDLAVRVGSGKANSDKADLVVVWTGGAGANRDLVAATVSGVKAEVDATGSDSGVAVSARVWEDSGSVISVMAATASVREQGCGVAEVKANSVVRDLRRAAVDLGLWPGASGQDREVKWAVGKLRDSEVNSGEAVAECIRDTDGKDPGGMRPESLNRNGIGRLVLRFAYCVLRK